jgi:F-type H+-transporting ATPase subunit delta
MNRVSKRYAAALFDYSIEQGVRERVSQDLAMIEGIAEEVPELMAMAATPTGARRCREVLENTVRPLVHPVMWRFILLLHTRRRLALLCEVSAAFAVLCQRADGEVSIRLATAYPLDVSDAVNIGAKIGVALSKWPRMQTSVKPDLLGGFVVAHDDWVYDFSIAGAMQQLRQRLLEDAAERGIDR